MDPQIGDELSLSKTIDSNTLTNAFIHGQFGTYECTICNEKAKYIYIGSKRNTCLLCHKRNSAWYITCINPYCSARHKNLLCYSCIIPQEVSHTLKQYNNIPMIQLLQSGVSSVHGEAGSFYQPLSTRSSLDVMLMVANHFPEWKNFSESVFLELGAGKAQVALCAARLFKAVVAVEIQRNICIPVVQSFLQQGIDNVLLLNMDVTKIGALEGKRRHYNSCNIDNKFF